MGLYSTKVLGSFDRHNIFYGARPERTLAALQEEVRKMARWAAGGSVIVYTQASPAHLPFLSPAHFPPRRVLLRLILC